MKQPVSLAALAACLCALMVTTACHSAEPIPPMIAGGWHTVSTDGDDIALAAQASVARLPAKGARLAKVVAAQRQVVAGTNYRLTVALNDGSTWDVTVWHKLDGTYQLTSAQPVPSRAANAAPVLRLAPDGFRIDGPAGEQVVAFSAAKADVIGKLMFRGQPALDTNAECGAGPVDFATWPDGLSLLFQNGALLGWSIDERSGALALAGGQKIGATLAQMRMRGAVTVEPSTLGEEFLTADGISGILDAPGEGGRVTALWAGLSCVFR